MTPEDHAHVEATFAQSAVAEDSHSESSVTAKSFESDKDIRSSGTTFTVGAPVGSTSSHVDALPVGSRLPAIDLRPINLLSYLRRPLDLLNKHSLNESSDSDSDDSFVVVPPPHLSSEGMSSDTSIVDHRDSGNRVYATIQRLNLRFSSFGLRVENLLPQNSNTSIEMYEDDASEVAASEDIPDDPMEEDLEDVTAMDVTTTTDKTNAETFADFKVVLFNMLKQMMFVSGETAEPSIETTSAIEEITRQQVVEIVGSAFIFIYLLSHPPKWSSQLTSFQLTRSTQLATRRGSRSISTDDLIFLIRHDKAKVSRLRTFLSWKDVRKNVKDSDDKGGADAAEFAAADDAAGVVAGPQDVASKPKNKRAKVGLAWDVNSFFSVQIPEREDEEDVEEEEQNYATLQRLAAADERTKNMTKEEYVFWSECRQASFTYRKSKRFREWAGFGIVTESKPNDDIVDILGFLTFEIVQTLTEEALKVKEREDHEKNRSGADGSGENAKKRKRETGLFDPPEEGRTPIEPRHILEAYRKLQATPQKAVAMLLHNGRVPSRLPIRLVSILMSLH